MSKRHSFAKQFRRFRILKERKSRRTVGKKSLVYKERNENS